MRGRSRRKEKKKMPRKTNTKLQEEGKVRGTTNQEIESMKDALRHFNFSPELKEDDDAEDR